MLLAYCLAHCPAMSLSELTTVTSEMVLDDPSIVVLEAFNIHAEGILTGPAWDLMTSTAAMELSHYIVGHTYGRLYPGPVFCCWADRR